MTDILISNKPLSIEQIAQYLESPGKISLSADSIKALEKSRRVVEQILTKNKPVYGVNTGFGKFSEVRISTEQVAELQKRLVLSHAAGVGAPMPGEIVRLMMLFKIKSLALGYSGCRPVIVQHLCDLLNNNILPVVPSQGSVGASGDLAPLAHMSLVLMGQGTAQICRDGKWITVPGAEALKSAGMRPLEFQAKEGLALLNGTQAISAYGMYAIIQSRNITKTADISAALSVEALLGSLSPFDERIHQIRGHKGQTEVAENFRAFLKDSGIIQSHKDSDHKVQDAYSLRCIPQVHGSVRDALKYIEQVFLTEVNGVTDNPLVFHDNGEVISGGNFHGAPVAHAADYLAIVLTDLGSMIERRIQHLIDPAVSELAPFLTKAGGLNSGFMIAHVTAAALVSENKVLSHPASVDSIPTSANKEDHVSMGTHAARKALQVSENLLKILAVELLCACQAIDLRAPLKGSEHSMAVHKIVREEIPLWEDDRLMHTDIEKAVDIIKSGVITKYIEKVNINFN